MITTYIISNKITYIRNNIILTSIYFLFIGYFNAFITLNIIDPLRYSNPLPDIGHTYLPFISNKVPNYMICIYVIYFILRQIFNKYRKEDILRFLWCINILFTLRIFTYTLTIEPPPLSLCADRDPNSKYIWNVLLYLYNNSDNTCLDMMFSGHACYFTIVYMSIINRSEYMGEKIINSFIFVIGMLSIIAAHIHYTSDVIVGLILSMLIYDKTI